MGTATKLAKDYEVTDGKKFRLKEIDPADTGSFKSKEEARKELKRGIEKLCDQQEKLYASDRWAVLLIFQAMDAAGKDSAIKHVMSGVNPQGCEVSSFKAPSPEELDHDYLWRCVRRLPERGRIGIFNRSYYEEVLVVRVHPEFLGAQKLPPKLVTKHIWKERFEDIKKFERYLTHNGIVVRKFFLHVSKDEQRKRFLSRIEDKHKNWKFSLADVRQREKWDEYMGAYEDMIRHTATRHAPWYVVPADHKWFTHAVVAEVLVETLNSLRLKFPKLDKAQQDALKVGREILLKQ